MNYFDFGGAQISDIFVITADGERRGGRILLSAIDRRARSTVERAEVVEAYYARLDASHPEENDAAILQQRGLESPHTRPGRLSLRETGVHVVDNWVEAYYARLDASHPEENDAAILQQRGLESPHTRPGRLSLQVLDMAA